MKTTLEQSTRVELISRIKLLNENSKAQWGKMNVYQMAKHCAVWDEWVLGKNKQNYKQELLGKIFGKIALKSHLKTNKPFGKNMPAGKLTVTEKQGDLELQKMFWAALIKEYEDYSNPNFVHDFFGKMTNEEIGILAYKHADHHLRQFAV